MMNRMFMFSIAATLSALTLSTAAFASGQHSGGHPSHMQHEHQMHQMHQNHQMQHGRRGGQMPRDGQHGAQGHHGHSAEGEHDGGPAGNHAHAGVNGRPGDPANVSRVIDMTMDDTMRFTPDRIAVRAGETVRLFLKNTGQVPHEFVLGSMDELRAHAEAMRRMPDMKHEEPNSITLGPRQVGGIVWQFDRAGAVDFACLIPGHFEAGMVGKVQVDQAL